MSSENLSTQPELTDPTADPQALLGESMPEPRTDLAALRRRLAPAVGGLAFALLSLTDAGASRSNKNDTPVSPAPDRAVVWYQDDHPNRLAEPISTTTAAGNVVGQPAQNRANSDEGNDGSAQAVFLPLVQQSAGNGALPSSTATPPKPTEPSATASSTATRTPEPSATATASSTATFTPTATETPVPKEWIGLKEAAAAYRSPDSKDTFMILSEGSYEYIGSIYNATNEPVCDIVKLADGSQGYVDPNDAKEGVNRFPYPGEIDWRTNEPVGNGHTVELKANDNKTRMPIIGSTSYPADRMTVTIGLKEDDQYNNPPPGSRHVREVIIQDFNLDPEAHEGWRDYATLSLINDQAWLAIPGQEPVYVGPAGSVWQLELQNGENGGSTIAVHRLDQDGNPELVTAVDGNRQLDLQSMIRAAIGQHRADISIEKLVIKAEPDMKLVEEPQRALNGGLAEAAENRLKVGFYVYNNIANILEDAPDGLEALVREANFVLPPEIYQFIPYNLRPYYKDERGHPEDYRRQFEDVMDRLGIEYYPYIHADPDYLKEEGRAGYDQDVADILAAHRGEGRPIIIIGNVENHGNRRGQLKDKALAQDVARKIVASGNQAFIDTTPFRAINGQPPAIYYEDRQAIAGLKRIPKDVPEITGIVYSPPELNHSSSQVVFEERLRKFIDELRKAYPEIIFGSAVAYAGFNDVNETYRTFVEVVGDEGVPPAFSLDGYMPLSYAGGIRPVVVNVVGYPGAYAGWQPHYGVAREALRDLPPTR